MKKILLPICAMLLCMTACKKDNDGILRLEIEQYTSDSKAHLDQNYAVWDSHDQVKLNGTNYDVIVSGNTATISGVSSSNTYQAIYPAKWVTASNTITYPATQTYRENSNGKQIIDAPMGAFAQASDGSAVLKFHNLGSILAVNVTGVSRVWKIEVTSATSNNINGDYAFHHGSRRNPNTPYIDASLSSSNHGTTTTTLICDGVAVPADGKTFYIAMPPISAQLTIKVYDDSYCYSLSQESTHTLEANHGYNAPFNAAECISNRVQYAPLPNQIWYTTNEEFYLCFFFMESEPDIISENEHFVATFRNTITSIPENAFNNGITSVTLPASVVVLKNHSFQDCESLTSITMPGVTVIGSGAFDYCSLDSLYLPKVDTLKVGSFYHTSLRAVYLPKVRDIQNYAFRDCSHLAHIYCKQTVAPTIAEAENNPNNLDVFSIPTTAVLHLPHGCTTTWAYNGTTIHEGWPGQYAYDL